MTRKARIDVPGTLHHVIVRGIERRKIFPDDTDRGDFIERLSDVIDETQTACFAWALIPLVHESLITLKDYDGDLRQLILRGNGREKPTFLLSNNFDTPLELLVGNYASRWRVENVISEAVKFLIPTPFLPPFWSRRTLM